MWFYRQLSIKFGYHHILNMAFLDQSKWSPHINNDIAPNIIYHIQCFSTRFISIDYKLKHYYKDNLKLAMEKSNSLNISQFPVLKKKDVKSHANSLMLIVMHSSGAAKHSPTKESSKAILILTICSLELWLVIMKMISQLTHRVLCLQFVLRNNKYHMLLE